jgi:hypothetical protein
MSSLEAQEVIWSNSKKLKGGAIFTKVIGSNDGGIYLLRYRNKYFTKSVTIDRYRNGLGYIQSKVIPLKRSRLLHVKALQDKLIVVSVFYNRQTLKNEVTGQFYTNDFQEIGEPFTILEAGLTDFYDKGDFRLRTSNNHNYVLVAHTSKSPKDKRILNIHLLDSTYKEQQQASYILEANHQDFFMKDLLVDNFGNGYFLTLERNFEGRRGDAEPNNVRLYRYLKDEDRLEDYLANDTGIFLQNSILTYDRFNHVVNLTSLYSETSPQSFVGLHHFSLPANDKPTREFYFLFDTSFRELLKGERAYLEGEELSDYVLNQVIPASDGGFTLIAERTSISSEENIMYVNGVPQTLSRNIYNYDDVLLMSLDSSMNVRWRYLINKNQSSLNDGGYYSSIITANTRSKIYLIYNDKLRSDGDVIQYTFDNKGMVSYKILIRSDEGYVSVIPSESRQVSYNELVIPTSKDKKFALLKLMYQN